MVAKPNRARKSGVYTARCGHPRAQQRSGQIATLLMTSQSGKSMHGVAKRKGARSVGLCLTAGNADGV
jgi:hypothetical protein